MKYMFKYNLEITSDMEITSCHKCRFTTEHHCLRSGHDEISCMWLKRDVTYGKGIPHDCPLTLIERNT